MCDCALTKPSAPAKVAVASGAAAGAEVGAVVGDEVGVVVGVGVATGAVLGFGVGAETPLVGGTDGELPPPPHALSIETASVAASGTSCR